MVLLCLDVLWFVGAEELIVNQISGDGDSDDLSVLLVCGHGIQSGVIMKESTLKTEQLDEFRTRLG